MPWIPCIPRYTSTLNAPRDYSYISTPLRNTSDVTVDQNSKVGRMMGNHKVEVLLVLFYLHLSFSWCMPSLQQVILRKPEPNPRLPAYISGVLAWGSPPVAGNSMQACMHEWTCICLAVASFDHTAHMCISLTCMLPSERLSCLGLPSTTGSP